MAEQKSDDDVYKWEISPHLDSDYDVCVTDSDADARGIIIQTAEMLWDTCEAGETRTLTIKHNKV